MKVLMIIALGLFSIASYAQDFDGHTWEAPYTLPVPKDWGVERFPIPINFAPQIPYKGVEDIRFSPGWAKVKSEDYWSYAFLWYLDGEIKLDPKIIDRHVSEYYTGLISANGTKIPKEKLVPVVTAFKEIKKMNGDVKTYTGVIEMPDYMTQDLLRLYCKVHWKRCSGENKTFLFFELSPKEFDHHVWRSLDQLWLDFKCKKDLKENIIK